MWFSEMWICNEDNFLKKVYEDRTDTVSRRDINTIGDEYREKELAGKGLNTPRGSTGIRKVETLSLKLSP